MTGAGTEVNPGGGYTGGVAGLDSLALDPTTGTLYGDSDPRVVSILGFRLEFSPEGRLLILRNDDVPGVVGMLGTMLGEARINIADIHLAREDGSSDALAVLRLDDAPSSELLEKLRSEEVVREVHLLDLG